MDILANPRLRQTIRIVFWLSLIFGIAMLLTPHPPKIFNRVGDKIEHMTGFAGLALLGAVGFGYSNRWKVAERLSFVGALIEVTQNIPALHRSCDIMDWVADTSGIIVATVLAGFALSRLDRFAKAVP